MSEPTVVILLSDKRSGSTMFQREICRHPDVQTVVYSPHTYLETHHWLKGAVVLGMPAQLFAGGRVYDGYGSRANARAYLIDCIRGNVPDFQIPRDDQALVFDGWEALCRRFARPVFFEKSPQLLAHWAGLSLLWDWIQQTKFRVKIVGLTRNPMAVMYSAFKQFHTDPEKRQFGWLETQKNLLAFQRLLPSDMFLHLRYEDIVAKPQEVFSKTCKFIGIPYHPDVGQGVRPDALSKWKDDPTYTFHLHPVVKQMAFALGYSSEDLENPPKPEPSRSYRFCQRWAGMYRLTLAHMRYRLINPFLLRLRARIGKYGE